MATASVENQPEVMNFFAEVNTYVSVIAMMSAKGLLDCKVLHGSVNGCTFYDFIHTHLINNLMAVIHRVLSL